jgi:transposase
MRSFITREDHVLIDATNIISYSERIGIAHVGYNSKREYDPQINLMMMFSSRMQMPVYYRVIPGDIREVSAFKTTLDECGSENVTIIADKGFYSEDNIETLESFNSKYIIPLRRSSMIIDYSRVEKREFEGFFVFQGRYIWHTVYKAGARQIHLFLDNNLMSREEADYLSRITTHPEKYSLQDFMGKRGRFGTIALLTNKTGSSSQDIYEDYKVRNQVETMIDAMKNILMADTSYMQNEDAFNGWMFINFIALQFYYRIYILLKENKLISKYSPKDLLMLLEYVRKARINDEWVTCEINANTKKLIEKLGLKPIT